MKRPLVPRISLRSEVEAMSANQNAPLLSLWEGFVGPDMGLGCGCMKMTHAKKSVKLNSASC